MWFEDYPCFQDLSLIKEIPTIIWEQRKGFFVVVAVVVVFSDQSYFVKSLRFI